MPVVYDFGNVGLNSPGNYICQFIKNRKLTDVYHSHAFYEIIIFLNGSCIQYLNGHLNECVKDTLIILRPGDLHCFKQQSEDISIISLSIGKDEFKDFCNAYEKCLFSLINNSKGPIFIPYRSASNDLAVKCGNIFSGADKYECKFLLAVILKRYIDHTCKTEAEIPQNLVFAINEMKKPENIKNGISAFIGLSNYSRTQLSRLMKKHLNTTIHEYILNLKLDYAYNALILTDDTIEEIAENAGYASTSHFNKIFKEKFKITPASLRKTHGIRTV